VSLKTTLLGRRLANWQAEHVKIGVWRGLPVLGLDGLASAAYGPEAALTILLPLGAAGLRFIAPITAVILAVLALLYLSYRQTIAAYPNGGGSYIVAKENLGTRAGLLAAAALMLDYVLNVAVGISAGVGALVSAIPDLHHHILDIALGLLVVITLVNLRGVRESGAMFGVPTYVFIVSLSAVLVTGIVKAIASGGHPIAVVPPPRVVAQSGAISLLLLLRSFASGCTAMTGVEAVSDGVAMFKEPRVKRAQGTLTAIVVTLAFFLVTIAWLSQAYGITATDQTKPGYQSVLSSLVAAVIGRGALYYVTIAGILAVLCLSANTSFSDFPRLCRFIAEDDFLPHSLANVGRRLVYSSGIIVLAVLAGALLVVFDGITDRLIPLFAVGAFGAFTLSQAGMVLHWRRKGGNALRLTLNAIGAITTGIALVVIIVAKFVEGAWITLVLIPLALTLFAAVKRHYAFVERQVHIDDPLDTGEVGEAPVVVIPIKSWDNHAEKALRFAMTISSDITVLHVSVDPGGDDPLRDQWQRNVERPMRDAGLLPPRLVFLPSPYRKLFTPIVEYVDDLRKTRSAMIAVILPDLVEGRWWEYLLHTHRAGVLRSLLLLRGNQRVVVISVPWYLERRRKVSRSGR